MALIIVSIIIFIIVSGVRRRNKNKSKQKKKQKQKVNSDEEEDIKAHSLISDLPSTEVQSIVIEGKELKPAKSQVFAWDPKVTGHKQNNKPKDKPQNKVKKLEK